MSIPLDSNEARVKGHTHICKICGKNFNCYCHYVGHVVSHALKSHRKRGILRVRGKLHNPTLLKNKEDKDDKIISHGNFHTTNVYELYNPNNIKRKVEIPRLGVNFWLTCSFICQLIQLSTSSQVQFHFFY